jgi:PKD repeat protein
VFVNTGTTWVQSEKLLASDGAAGDSFAEKLELSNGVVVVGAPYANDSQVLHSGAAYIFNMTPPNKLPHPEFSWTPQYPFPHQQTTFNASASYDIYGSIVKYEWDWNNDGVYDESHTTPTAVHWWWQPGGYLVTLRVTDNDGGIAVITKDVKVLHFQWTDHI